MSNLPLTSGYVDTISNSCFFILLCSCPGSFPIVAYKTILVLLKFVPWVLFFFNCINVVKEKESGRLEVAIILKFSAAKFKSKIRRCSNLTFRSLKVSFTFLIFRPFPSSRNSTYQNETKCKSFLLKMSFICMRIKNHFHINSFAFSLALKLRLEATYINFRLNSLFIVESGFFNLKKQ